MNYKFLFLPLALLEYEDAVWWYKIRSTSAAERFVAEVTNKIKLICRDPFRYRNQYKKFRETSIKRYPFYIIYFIDEEKKRIIISSIYHHRRSPKRKYNK